MKAPPFSWRHFPFVFRKVMGLEIRQDQNIKRVGKFSENSCPFYFFITFFHFPDWLLFYFQDREPKQWLLFSKAVLNNLLGSVNRTKRYSVYNEIVLRKRATTKAKIKRANTIFFWSKKYCLPIDWNKHENLLAIFSIMYIEKHLAW